MTDRADRFRRLEELFFELAELGPTARDARLDDVRREDPELAGRLRALLDRDADGERAVGPYRLLRRLGAGGMGEVWEAEQRTPVVRRVAVKLLRAGLAVGDGLRRFRAEREAMARLNDPGIAHVLDAGISADGRPYVVMELVDGEPITSFCARRGLGPRARLELFVEVCRAVHHAHQKAVIHRDLKPSNVLVVERAGRPLPKVIDFGIARALAGDDAMTRVTRHGDVLGTLEYMSPEQAAGGAASVDTRSDVYALGVLLYQLLTGAVPLATAEGDALETVLRRIREQAPVPPSLQPGVAGGGGDRGVDRRRLRGDLDWIALRALAKEPARRYPSASELLADVERHLNDEPVLAGPPTRRYRLAKLVRRHRLPVLAATLVAMALTAGVVGTTVAMLRARRAEVSARREAAVSELVAGFLVDLFRGSEPATARGADVTAREILAAGAARVRDGLGEAPAVRARLLRTLGQVQIALGDHETALELLSEALDAERRAGDGVTAEERARTLVACGRAHRGRDDLDAAHAAFATAQTLLEGAVGEDDPQLLPVLRERADLAITRRDHAAARELLERAVRLADAAPASRAEAGRLEAELGFLDYQEGDFAAARDRYAASLEDLEAALGGDHPDIVSALNDLAVVEKRLGHRKAALALYDRGAAVAERVLGPDHAVLGDLLHNRSRLLLALGRPDQATAAAERALEIQEAVHGEDHRMVVAVLGGLGDALAAAGDTVGARSAYRVALARMRNHPDRFYGYLPLSTARRLAALERREGDPAAALRVCHEALSSSPDGGHDRHRALLQLEQAAALLALDRREQAESRAAAALAVLEADETDDPWAASLHRARFEHLAGDEAAAVRALGTALARGADPTLIARDPELGRIRR